MRIALIAMSGVRACNPELTALGLSLPGFVERGRTIASLPSLGLLTLAALTDDRFDVDYYEVDDIADLDPLPGCDVAALSSYSEPGAWEKCTLFDFNFEPMGMTVAELESGLVELGRYIYSEGNLASRRAGFKEQVRSGARRRSGEVMTA